MLTVTILKGLPASGKTTWAKEQVSNAPKNSIKRVNKDDLRQMLDNGRWSKGNESFVLEVRDWIIISSLLDGCHVIVDDTNLEDKHEKNIREMVRNCVEAGLIKAHVMVKEFDTPLQECLIRDRKRANSVGDKVITDMYNKYYKGKQEIVAPIYRDHDKIESCIVCDIDGTLARMVSRGPFEFEKVFEDGCYHHIAELLSTYAEAGKTIILISGREEAYRRLTEEWLEYWEIPYSYLFMRETGDNRKDALIKKEIFHNHIEPNYDVDFVLDDRDRVVDMWRKGLNIPCLQVYYGDF